ncbi:MAG: hypothetical protein AAFR44_08655 [Pseudomonadota bacterium]
METDETTATGTEVPIDESVTETMQGGPIMGLDQEVWIFIFMLGVFLVTLMRLLGARGRKR